MTAAATTPATIWPATERRVRALSAMVISYGFAGAAGLAAAAGAPGAAPAAAVGAGEAWGWKSAVSWKVITLLASRLDTRSTRGNQPLFCRFEMKSATAVRPLDSPPRVM